MSPQTPTVADIGEQELLRRISQDLELARAEIGPGDDAAVLPVIRGNIVVTTDSMVENLDWRNDWSSAHDVGVKVIAQNIADVMAMGASPTGVVVALAVNEGTLVSWVLDLGRGMADELRRAGTGCLGGDLSGTGGGPNIITITALGEIAPGVIPLRRDVARPGDLVVVSDQLGRSHAGLLLLQNAVPDGPTAVEDDSREECLRFHRAPWPRYSAGVEAVGSGMRCAMDVSDSLTQDAARLAAASGVAIRLNAEKIAEMAQPLGPVVGERAQECVLYGGEEHALLGTCQPDAVPAGWHVLGRVEAGAGLWLDDEPLAPRGWMHFEDGTLMTNEEV